MNPQNGKGDKPRKEDLKKIRKNWDEINWGKPTKQSKAVIK